MLALRTLGEALRLLVAESDTTARRQLAIAFVIVVAGGLLAAVAPLALKHLVDAVADGGASSPAWINTALTAGAAYLLAVCGGRLLAELRPVMHGRAEQRLYSLVSRRFFGHLLDLPLEFHLGRRSGALGQTLAQALIGCQFLVAHVVTGIVPVVVEVTAVAIILMTLDQPALVIAFSVTATAYIVVFTRSVSQLATTSHAVSNASVEAHAILSDSLINYESIKSFTAENHARERYDQATSNLETEWATLRARRARVGVAVAAVFTASLAASLAVAAVGVRNGSLSIGGFVLANVYMLQMVRPLELLGSALRDVSQALGFLCPFLAVLKEPAEQQRAAPTRAPGFVETKPTTANLRFENVSFGYVRERPVLRGLNVDVATGQTVAIVGATGAGKSSIVRLLLRFYLPQAGRILLNEVPIDELTLNQLRAAIAVVPQDTVLLNETIACNIAIGRAGASRSDIELAARSAHLHQFIASLPAGYETVVGERGLKLSGGERQRIAIARAVLKRPQLYVFDEATSALDGQTEAEILRNLMEISVGCTTVIISHRLATVLHADEILVLDNGQVSERGSHERLLRMNGLYASQWRFQMARARADARSPERDDLAHL